jgi:hypothetical protein
MRFEICAFSQSSIMVIKSKRRWVNVYMGKVRKCTHNFSLETFSEELACNIQVQLERQY